MYGKYKVQFSCRENYQKIFRRILIKIFKPALLRANVCSTTEHIFSLSTLLLFTTFVFLELNQEFL